MNTKSIWKDKVPEKDGLKNPINDIAVSPDGTRVVVGVGNRVLMYNGETGELMDSLRGETKHFNQKNCVSKETCLVSIPNHLLCSCMLTFTLRSQRCCYICRLQQ